MSAGGSSARKFMYLTCCCLFIHHEMKCVRVFLQDTGGGHRHAPRPTQGVQGERGFGVRVQSPVRDRAHTHPEKNGSIMVPHHNSC